MHTIEKSAYTITYSFSVTDGLQKYFSGKPFWIEYPIEISSVPDAIAAVPFVCSILPIMWLTDCELIVPELDKAFCECIPNVRKGYETMFPESTFGGKLIVQKIVECDRSAGEGCVAFFSGGLDATQTLVSHFDEKPHLVSIWGSDIKFDNKEGWQAVHSGIADTCERFSLNDIVIRSTFREFDNERVLDNVFSAQLKDGWWHGVKHSVGLLGHAAPYVYINNISTVYIASTNCALDGPVRCASNPLTDNHVRFADAKVIHDGFEFSRQDKAHNIVDFVQKTGNKVFLHVCWESSQGSNCCRCEKCYRTMANLLAEGADPTLYGFPDTAKTIDGMKRYITITCRYMQNLPDYWPHIQKRVHENKRMLRKKPYWKEIRWLEKTDFQTLHKKNLPFVYRVRRRLSKSKFYQGLHKVKAKIQGK